MKENEFDVFVFIKKHPIIFAITLIVIFIMVPISFYVENPWGIGFIPRSEAGNVLGYYGAILGGGLTIFGVAWTLDRQNKEHKDSLKLQKKISDNELAESKRQFDLELKQKQDELNRLKEQRVEDLVIQYKPIIIIKNTKVKEIAEGLNVIFTFENQGRGEATNVEFLTFLANNRDEYMSSQFSTKRQIIPQNQKSHFSLMILRIDKTKPHNIKAGEITALLPIERNKFGFTACFSYCNPIDNTKKYFLTFDFYVEKAVIGDEIYKLESFQQSIDDLKKEWIVTTENIKYKS